jgi:acetyl esterase/lipase
MANRFLREAVRLRPAAAACLALMAAATAWAGTRREVRPQELEVASATPPTVTESYGSDPLQAGDLRLPPGKGPFPLAVMIHGGCWTKGFATRKGLAPLASELTRRGLATWNVEYRQVGDSGAGWPGTFLDWAVAADHVRQLAKRHPIDLTRVVAVGHSAGAHAALWLAARGRLPADSPVRGGPPLPLRAVVAIDGVADIARFIGVQAEVCGKAVMEPFMGGDPSQQPDRYAQGNPFALLPLGAPTVLVASEVMSPDEAERVAAAARERKDTVVVLALKDAWHFNMLMPGTPSSELTIASILDAAGSR